MPVELTLGTGTLYAFLLVLARVSGALVFVPFPGLKGGSEPARAGLALMVTIALSSRWPSVHAETVTPAGLVGWAVAEASLGIGIGVCVAIVLEAFTLAAQILGLQAGYAYASTIDPNTDADSGVLLVFAQLMAGMIFFALGLDREVLRMFALSFDQVPVGTYAMGPGTAAVILRLGSSLFSVGLRLAFPVVGLLVMVDVALALAGRLNQQLQLLSLAFPIKMLAGLVILSWISAVFPRVLYEFHELGGSAIRQILSHAAAGR